MWYDWQWDEAYQALERAISLNPSEAGAYLDLGWYYAVSGQFGQAIAYMEKAVSLDQLSLEYNIDLADILRMSGEYGRAREIGLAMQELYPDNSEAFWILGMIEYTCKDYPSAVAYFREAVRLSGEEIWSEMHLAMALAKTGQRAEAEQLLKKLEASSEVEEAAHVEMAPVYWNLGQKQKSLDWLERSYKWHANWMISLRMDPLWEEMQGEARFEALVEKMEFP